MDHYEAGDGALCLNLANVYVQAYRIGVLADTASEPPCCLRSDSQADSSGDIFDDYIDVCAEGHVNHVGFCMGTGGRVRAGEDGCLVLVACVHEASPGVYGLRLDGCWGRQPGLC